MTEATFTVNASGAGNFTYQWYRNTSNSTEGGTPIDGAMSNTYTIPAGDITTDLNGTYYYCVATQSYGESTNTITSNTAKLNVIKQASITENVQPVTVYESVGPATFEVTAEGDGTITYQWYENTTNSNTGGTKISGATGSTYTIPSEKLTADLNGKYYYVEITQRFGNSVKVITSNAALLTVVETEIQASKQDVVLYVGGQNDKITLSGTNAGEFSIAKGTSASIATAELEGSILTITPVSAGETSVIVRESNGNKEVTINIHVKDTTIEACEQSVVTYVGDQSKKVTLSGAETGAFVIDSKPDITVATAELNGNILTITPISAGETSVTIRETNGNKKVTISILVEKATPIINLSSNNGSVNYNATNSFTVTPTSTPAINGTWEVTSSHTNYVTIISGNGETATNGVATTINYKGVAATTEQIEITIKFIPDDTENYNTQTLTYLVTVNKIPATNPTLTKYTGTYDGEPHTIGVTGGSGGEIQYKNAVH